MLGDKGKVGLQNAQRLSAHQKPLVAMVKEELCDGQNVPTVQLRSPGRKAVGLRSAVGGTEKDFDRQHRPDWQETRLGMRPRDLRGPWVMEREGGVVPPLAGGGVGGRSVHHHADSAARAADGALRILRSPSRAQRSVQAGDPDPQDPVSIASPRRKASDEASGDPGPARHSSGWRRMRGRHRPFPQRLEHLAVPRPTRCQVLWVRVRVGWD